MAKAPFGLSGEPTPDFVALLALGKDRGYLTPQDLMTRFEGIELDPDFVFEVIERIEAEDIEWRDTDELLSDEDLQKLIVDDLDKSSRSEYLVDWRPTWMLVLEAAAALTAAGRTPFQLVQLVEEVQWRDPSRVRTSIYPTVYGMTVDVDYGPPSSCGRPLRRVARGWYELDGMPSTETTIIQAPGPERPVLQTSSTKRTTGGRRSRSVGEAEVCARAQELAAGFDRYVADFDRRAPFVRKGQYELHRATINRLFELGSVSAAIHDNHYVLLLYSTLQAWGIGRRRSVLRPLDQLQSALYDHIDSLTYLEQLRIEDLAEDVPALCATLDRLITELEVVDNQARIVAGTKTLHHLLPRLVPPMDRAWTGAFFGWGPLDPQNHQRAILTEAFSTMAEIANRVRPGRLVGPGWRTSPTKVLDNALVGYCMAHAIGG